MQFFASLSRYFVHIYLFNIFLITGAVYLGQQSFGHNLSDVTNLDAFACNFCNEIMRAFTESDAINNLISFLEGEFDNLKAIDKFSRWGRISYENYLNLINSHRLLTNSRLELHNSSCMLLKEGIADEPFEYTKNEMKLAESIPALRKYSREGKVVWHHSRNTNEKSDSHSFAPIEIDSDTLYGTVKCKQETMLLSTTSVIGIRIAHSQSTPLRRCWKSYLSMSTQSAHPNSLFPIPIKVIHDNTRRTTFVFENPKVTSLSELSDKNPLGLLVGLHRHPHVILAWCQQLVSVIETLHGIGQITTKGNVMMGMLLTTPTLCDAFVKGDGHLLFGNQLFDSEDKSSLRDKENNLRIMTQSFMDLLSNLIGLSRSLSINAAILEGNNNHLLKQDSVLKLEIDEDGFNLEKIFIISNDLVHELQIIPEYSEGNHRGVRYKYTKESTFGKKSLEISGNAPESFTIKFQFLDGTSLSSDLVEPFEPTQMIRSINIKVVDKINTPSIELQETISIIESSHQLQQNVLLLEALAIKRVLFYSFSFHFPTLFSILFCRFLHYFRFSQII